MMYRPSNRLRDAALLAPIGGVILFLPPYVRIFDQDTTIFGIPFLHVALFSIWTFGIVLTAFLARRLTQDTADGDATPDQPDGHPTDQSPVDATGSAPQVTRTDAPAP